MESKKFQLQAHGGACRVKNMTTGRFPDREGTFLIGFQVKFTRILDLFMIATQIHPVFTRKHMTAQISCEYCDKNRD